MNGTALLGREGWVRVKGELMEVVGGRLRPGTKTLLALSAALSGGPCVCFFSAGFCNRHRKRRFVITSIAARLSKTLRGRIMGAAVFSNEIL